MSMSAIKLYIITGASRGLGAALAGLLIDPAHRLVCMARTSLPALQERALAANCVVDAVRVDLCDAAAAVSALEAALAGIDPDTVAEICLINNAGTVLPIRPADRLTPAEIVASVAVNLAAPMALTAAFLRLTADWPDPCQRKVVNITSGAARKPYQGWSVYCATKAALDQFSRCVAVEQRDLPRGARIAALAPGMIDTDMQAEIRAVLPGDFKEQSRFLALKESGALASPEAAARRLLIHLQASDFGVEPVVDLRSTSA
jgi:benzil reductase ((S)-benzoin forming)